MRVKLHLSYIPYLGCMYSHASSKLIATYVAEFYTVCSSFYTTDITIKTFKVTYHCILDFAQDCEQ